MESDGSDLRWTLIQLRVGELATPVLQVFARQLQSMQKGAMNARELRKSSTQPRLLKRFLGHLRCPPPGNVPRSTVRKFRAMQSLAFCHVRYWMQVGQRDEVLRIGRCALLTDKDVR